MLAKQEEMEERGGGGGAVEGESEFGDTVTDGIVYLFGPDLTSNV